MGTQEERKVPKEVFGALRKSGFPFQTAVAHVVETSGMWSSSGKWSVYKSEYPWQDPSGKDQFLDLVIRKGSWYIAVECKKTDKETFTFLRPLGLSNTGECERVRCLRGKPNFRLYVEDWCLWPQSFESEFCVVSNSMSGSKSRLLEYEAHLVVCATGAFAKDQEARNTREVPSPDRLYFSVIVTNAPLYSVRYNPNEVSLKSGQFKHDPKEIKDVPWVRFRKAFTSGNGRDVGDRTVFIINSQHLSEFLDRVEVPPTDNESQRNSVLLNS